MAKKAKDVLMIEFKIAPITKHIITEDKELIELGSNFDLSVIEMSVNKRSDHSDKTPITSMILRQKRIKPNEIGDEEEGG